LVKQGVKLENIEIKDVLKEIKRRLEQFTFEYIGRVPMIILNYVYINRNKPEAVKKINRVSLPSDNENNNFLTEENYQKQSKAIKEETSKKS
jgi:hypothetical protein